MINLKKENINRNNSITVSVFSILLSALVLYLNTENDNNINKSILISLGYVLFIINFEYNKWKYSFCILTVLLIFSFYLKETYYILSVIGFSLFLKNFLNNRSFYPYLIGLILVIFVGSNIVCNHQTDFNYKLSLTDNFKGQDHLFHSVIASNYKTKGICTTSLHDSPKLNYWDLSNRIAANFSDHLGIRALDFYNLIFPIFIWSIFLFLSYQVLDFFISEKLQIANYLIYLVFPIVLASLTFFPNFGPVNNFLKWEAHKILCVPLALSLLILFAFCFYEILKIENFRISLLLKIICTIFFISIISQTKLFIVHFILLSVFVSIFYKIDKKLRSSLFIMLASSFLTYFYFHLKYKGLTNHIIISFFDLWNQCAPQTSWLWSPFILGFPLLSLLYLKYHKTHLNFRSLKSWLYSKHLISSLLIICFVFSVSVTIPFSGPYQWNLLYYLDTYYIILSLPLSYYLYNFFKLIHFKSINIIHTIIVFFLVLCFLQSSIFGINRWYQIFNDSNFIKNFNSTDSKIIDSISLCNTLKNLYTEKKPNSVLWIPRNNIQYSHTFDLNYEFAKPFAYSAMSELPLLFGFPSTDDNKFKDAGFGFNAYQSFKFNPDSNLEYAKLEAKQLGYTFLVVLDSSSEFRQFSL